MNSRLKTILSTTLVASMLLGMLAALSPAFAVTADLKIEDARNGSTTIHYTNNDAPPGGYFTVNVSIYNIVGLAAWQMNITWNKALFEIVNLANNQDIFVPSDSMFGNYADIVDPTYEPGMAFQMVGIKSGGPTSVDGSGRLCAVKFHVLQVPNSTVTMLTCPIHIVLTGEYPIYTSLVDADSNDILYTPFDGTYEYEWEPPILKKPWLTIAPTDVVLGNAVSWPKIVNTTAENFSVSVLMNNVEAASMLTCMEFAFKYNATYFRLLPDAVDPSLNATEGPFMNETWQTIRTEDVCWAPWGTDFFTIWGGVAAGKIETQYVLALINPDFNMTPFPDTAGLTDAQRVICTFNFQAKVQEEKPWEAIIAKAFWIDYMLPSLPDHLFLDALDEWIPHDQAAHMPQQCSYHIFGYSIAMGLQLDVYTQYPEPFGGQYSNQTADMYYPQGTVHLYANLTYNGDVVQNKPVAFQIYNEQGFVNFTKTAVTDENGVAHVWFGIEWPCSGAEDSIFGIWEVDATTTVREMQANDSLWFKVYWLTYELKVTADNPPLNKGTIEAFTVSWISFRQQPVQVLIHLVVMDDLRVPIGKASTWVTVGDPDLVWCENRTGSVHFEIFIPKWAFVGLNGELEASVLSDFPSHGGVPLCPEATAQVEIKK